MQVLSKSYFNNNPTYRPQNKITFGQIRPEHLFIRMDGFPTNYYWADEMIKCAEKVKDKIRSGCSFNDVFDSIRLKYKELYSKSPPDKDGQNQRFGVLREKVNGIYSAEGFQVKNKYGAYRKRFLDFFAKFPNEIIYNVDHSVFTGTAKVRQHVGTSNAPVELASMEVELTEKPDSEKFVALWSAPVFSIKPALKHVGNIYDSIVKIKRVQYQYELEVVNRGIAQMHWFLAQLMPCQRGSAGITDVLTKSIYESLGIQVHPWKAGLAPDLEAFVRPLDDYVDNYTNFFDKPPEII